MACVSARSRVCYNDEALQNADTLNQIHYMKVSFQDVSTRFDGLDAKIQALGMSTSALQRGVAEIEQHQNMVFANVQEMIATALNKKVNSGAPSLTDFDRMVSSYLQPLAVTLGDMRLLLAHASDPKPQRPEGKPNGVDAIEQNFSTTLENVGQEGSAAMPRPARSHACSDLRQELAAFQKSLLADLKSSEEFCALRESLCSNLNRQNDGSPQQLAFDEFRRQQEAFGKKLSADIEGLLNLHLEKVSTEWTSLTPQSMAPHSSHLDLHPVGSSSKENQEILRTAGALSSHTCKDLPEWQGFAIKKDLGMQGERATLEKKHTQREASFYLSEVREIATREETSMAAIFINDPDIMTPTYHVEDYYKTEGTWQAVARSTSFDNFSTFVVACNAVWIGIESDRSHESNVYDAPWIFIVVANLFILFFLFDWVVRFMAFKECKYAYQDGWFKFDTVLLASMIFDIWIFMPIFKTMEHRPLATRASEPFRCIRLLKLTRMARLAKFVPELVTMIKGLIRSFRAILSTLVLIVFLVYVCGIMIHGLLREEDELNKQLYTESLLDFSTLTRSMWTLIMDGSLLLDNSCPLMTTLVFSNDPKQVIAGVIFTSFALLSAYLILQMLIGVLCDVVARVNEEQRNAKATSIIRQQLLLKLNEVAVDGKITREDLLALMTHHDSVAVLHHLKINRLFLMQLQDMLFESKSSMSITVRQALEMMLLCQSDNPATVEVLAGGFCFIARELRLMQQAIPS